MKSCEYPQMTNEEYRSKLQEIFSSIHENQKLRFFFTFISETWRLDGKEKGGAVHE